MRLMCSLPGPDGWAGTIRDQVRERRGACRSEDHTEHSLHLALIDIYFIF